MGRLFNNYYPVRNNNDANTIVMANKIVEISNDKLSVYSITSSRTILLQYLDTNLILEIAINGNDLYGYFGSISTGSYVRASGPVSRYSYAMSYYYRICYSEIDDTLCCLTVGDEAYKGQLSNTTNMLTFTIANTLINNNQYLTCAGAGGSNSFFGAADGGSSCAHFTMTGDIVGTTEGGCINIMSLNSLRSAVFYTGTALLVPYYFIANAANHTLMGEIQFSGQNGKRLYALLPPTFDGLVDPRENYIINGTSYKACGDVIKLFL